ncbi:MAG: three-Cys-motif partner protein TcmP [Chloroflexota bacterium]|nr:three-Cys-motif partner protein TcmP [Chloroflexota bacterium]
MAESASNRFGGDWTAEKLRILESYLDAYTTALKNQPFKLMYIDAFAGSGSIDLGPREEETRDLIEGSAQRAVTIVDKPFDRLVFVEKDPNRFRRLERLRTANPERDIRTERSDANDYLEHLNEIWQQWRGVLFLDPFATEVNWETIERISGFNALDTWLLFPASSIARILPRSKRPEDVSEGWTIRLNKIFGDESWRDLYSQSPQLSFFEEDRMERDPGVEGIVTIYKRKLKGLFRDRFLDESITLKNSRNSPLFEFMFCVGSPSGIGPAKRIARHLMRMST